MNTIKAKLRNPSFEENISQQNDKFFVPNFFKKYIKSSFYQNQTQSGSGSGSRSNGSDTFNFFEQKTISKTKYFSVHGFNAKYLLTKYPDLQIVTRTIGKGKGKRIDSMIFKEGIYKAIISWLLKEEKKIIYEYKYSSSRNEFIPNEYHSPGGNYSDEILVNMLSDDSYKNSSLPSIIICIFKKVPNGYETSGGIINKGGNKMFFHEWEDNEQMSVFESLIIQLNICEIVYKDKVFNEKDVKKGKDNKYKKKFIREKVIDIGRRNEVPVKILEKEFMMWENNEKSFDKLRKIIKKKKSKVNNNGEVRYEEDNKLEQYKGNKKFENCMICLCVGLEYLGIKANDDYKNIFSIEKYMFKEFMRLDSSVLRSLNIIESQDSFDDEMSLFSLLNKCLTRMGSRMLNTWLRQPLTNQKRIQSRLDIVEIFTNESELTENLSTHLKFINDLSVLVKKFQIFSAKIVDLMKFYDMCLKFIKIYEVLVEFVEGKEVHILHTEFLLEMDSIIKDGMAKYIAFIESVIDLDKFTHCGKDINSLILKADFDEELRTLNEDLEKKMDKRESIRDEFLQKYSIDDDNIEFFSPKKGKGNKKAKEKCLIVKGRNHVDEISSDKKCIILHKVKTTIYFTTKKFRKYTESMEKIIEKYINVQKKLEPEAVKIARSFISFLEGSTEIIGKLDILISFAKVSASNGYVKPEIIDNEGNNEKIIKIVDGKHPCVDQMLSFNTESMTDNASSQFIPNDLLMTSNEGRFHVITGPNMGGKSTYIRQNAIIVLMAQIGCFVPAKEAIITIRDGIYARIGANDSQIRGVSTFMAEMLEAASILESARPNSLIIIDELGRGTSTDEGFGLAWAISENIINIKKSFCLFATHFHELTSLKKNFGKLVKAKQMQYSIDHVDAMDVDKIILTYKVQDGIGNNSFGIDVAEKAGFPLDVITRAKRKLDELENLSSEENAIKKRKIEKKEPENVDQKIVEQFVCDILKSYVRIPMNQISQNDEDVKYLKEKISKLKKRVAVFYNENKGKNQCGKALGKMIKEYRKSIKK